MQSPAAQVKSQMGAVSAYRVHLDIGERRQAALRTALNVLMVSQHRLLEQLRKASATSVSSKLSSRHIVTSIRVSEQQQSHFWTLTLAALGIHINEIAINIRKTIHHAVIIASRSEI